MDIWNLIERYQILAALAVIALAWLIWQLQLVLIILFISYIISAATLPAVEYFEKRDVHRLLTIGIIYAFIACVVGALGFLLYGPVMGGIQNLSNQIQLESGSINLPGGYSFQAERLLNPVQGSSIVGIASNAVTIFTGIISAFILSMYLTYDWKRIRDWLAEQSRNPEKTLHLIDVQVETVGAWLRGQIIISSAVGILVYGGLALVGLPSATALALLAGVFELIPYAGPIIASIPGIMLGAQEGVTTGLLVAGIYVIVQQIENHFLTPLVMKRAVQLHPIVVIGVVLTGYAMLGIVGAIIAIPLSSLIWTSYKTLREYGTPKELSSEII